MKVHCYEDNYVFVLDRITAEMQELARGKLSYGLEVLQYKKPGVPLTIIKKGSVMALGNPDTKEGIELKLVPDTTYSRGTTHLELQINISNEALHRLWQSGAINAYYDDKHTVHIFDGPQALPW